MLARGENLKRDKSLRKHLEDAGVYEPIKFDKEKMEQMSKKAHSKAKQIMEMDK